MRKGTACLAMIAGWIVIGAAAAWGGAQITVEGGAVRFDASGTRFDRWEPSAGVRASPEMPRSPGWHVALHVFSLYETAELLADLDFGYPLRVGPGGVTLTPLMGVSAGAGPGAGDPGPNVGLSLWVPAGRRIGVRATGTVLFGPFHSRFYMMNLGLSSVVP